MRRTSVGWATPRNIGSAVASDAFPFADGLLAAVEAGATAVIRFGGLIRDGGDRGGPTRPGWR